MFAFWVVRINGKDLWKFRKPDSELISGFYCEGVKLVDIGRVHSRGTVSEWLAVS